MRPNDKKGDKKVIELDKAKYTKDLYTCGEPQGVPVDQEVEFMTGYKDKQSVRGFILETNGTWKNPELTGPDAEIENRL